jgi:hypothetical protein
VPEEVIRTYACAEHPGVDQIGPSQHDALADDRALVVSDEINRPVHRLQLADQPIAIGIPRPAESGGRVTSEAGQLQGDGVASGQQCAHRIPHPRQFGNKFELQLATLDFATDLFRREVWKPAEHVPAGMPRLLAICDSARHPAVDSAPAPLPH